jgi:TIR domain
MAGHVYLSYDGQDIGYVRRLVDHLAGSWLTVWVDPEAESGEHWHPGLEAPLRAASVVLVVMSPASQNSDRVRGEITFAHSIGKPIIPLLLAGRAFFSQGGNAPENVIGGQLPDDSLIERLGDLSQTPITHRRSGKPGRGSSSRERDSTTTTGTALIAPMSAPSGQPGFGPPRSGGPAYGGSAYGGLGSGAASYGGPGSGGPAYGGPGSGAGLGTPGHARGPYPPPPANGPRQYQPDDDSQDDEPRRFRPVILFGAAAAVVVVVGIISVVLLSGSGSSNRPTTPVGASNPRTTGAVPPGSSAAFQGPTLTGTPSSSTSKKPTTTTTKPATTTTTVTTVTTTDPPAIPNPVLSVASEMTVGASINGTVHLSVQYPSDLTVTLSGSGVDVSPSSVTIPANSTADVSFSVSATSAGPATVNASVSGQPGHSDSANVTVTGP